MHLAVVKDDHVRAKGARNGIKRSERGPLREDYVLSKWEVTKLGRGLGVLQNMISVGTAVRRTTNREPRTRDFVVQPGAIQLILEPLARPSRMLWSKT